MGSRLRAVALAWREDWRATMPATKVVLAVLSALGLAWGIFAVWFWFGYDF